MRDHLMYVLVGIVGGVAFHFAIFNIADPGLAILLSFLILVACLVLANALQTRRYCPRCNSPLPKFRRPLNKRQFLYGGWTCQKCGCEVDKAGKAVGKKGRTQRLSR